jgi:hypothetical protein
MATFLKKEDLPLMRQASLVTILRLGIIKVARGVVNSLCFLSDDSHKRVTWLLSILSLKKLSPADFTDFSVSVWDK